MTDSPAQTKTQQAQKDARSRGTLFVAKPDRVDVNTSQNNLDELLKREQKGYWLAIAELRVIEG